MAEMEVVTLRGRARLSSEALDIFMSPERTFLDLHPELLNLVKRKIVQLASRSETRGLASAETVSEAIKAIRKLAERKGILEKGVEYDFVPGDASASRPVIMIIRDSGADII